MGKLPKAFYEIINEHFQEDINAAMYEFPLYVFFYNFCSSKLMSFYSLWGLRKFAINYFAPLNNNTLRTNAAVTSTTFYDH